MEHSGNIVTTGIRSDGASKQDRGCKKMPFGEDHCRYFSAEPKDHWGWVYFSHTGVRGLRLIWHAPPKHEFNIARSENSLYYVGLGCESHFRYQIQIIYVWVFLLLCLVLSFFAFNKSIKTLLFKACRNHIYSGVDTTNVHTGSVLINIKCPLGELQRP